MSVLQLSDVFAGYGEVEILHGVAMVVEAGEVVAIIGPNGAGKSTLLKAVFGLVPVHAGHVLLSGNDVTNEAPHQLVDAGLAYVPQVDNVFPSLTIEENLEMGGFTRRDGLRERLERAYQLFPDLAGRRRELAGRLSGGQRQMLALARALMLEPELLLLDEPSAGLSPKMVGSVFEKMSEVNRDGTAILLVEQNVREALAFSRRAYVLVTGENRLEGESRELLQHEDVGRLFLGE